MCAQLWQLSKVLLLRYFLLINKALSDLSELKHRPNTRVIYMYHILCKEFSSFSFLRLKWAEGILF